MNLALVSNPITFSYDFPIKAVIIEKTTVRSGISSTYASVLPANTVNEELGIGWTIYYYHKDGYSQRVDNFGKVVLTINNNQVICSLYKQAPDKVWGYISQNANFPFTEQIQVNRNFVVFF